MTSRTKLQKRKQTIQFLVALGVDLPLSTKLPDKELKRRLRHAINASQSLDSITSPLRIGTLPKWGTIQPDPGDLVLKMWRFNVGELVVADRLRRIRQLARVELEVDPFVNFGEILMHIAEDWGKGITSIFFKSESQNSFIIAVRVSVTWFKLSYVSADFLTRF